MNRGLVRAALVVLLAVMLQVTWAPALRAGGEWPDLPLVTALVIGVLSGGEIGLAAGLTAGLASGLLSGFAGAAFVLSRLGAVSLVGRIRGLWEQEHVVTHVLAVLLGTLVAEGLFALLNPAILETVDYLPRLGWRCLLNALATPLIVPAVEKLGLTAEVSGP